jgi:prevent-host-death family protein
MIIATVQEGQAGLAKLIDAAVAGEEVFISKEGKRIVRLTAVETQPQPVVKRKPGALAGQGFWVSPDFDDPDPDILLMFENGEA